MTQTPLWVYPTAPIHVHTAKQILDDFGADGWELVTLEEVRDKTEPEVPET